MGFKGEYLNKFDDAGRISLPAKMREELRAKDLGDALTAYYAFQTRCLKILPKTAFEKMEKAYLENPPKNEAAARAYRYMFSSSVDLEINSSGRVSIPAGHRAKANLGEECYIIGVNDKIEMWNKELWESEAARVEADFSENREGFGEDIDCMLF